MNVRSTIIKSLVTVAAAFAISACRHSSESNDKVTIAVSLPPQAELLRAIGGDSINIVTLLRADSNPETFETSVSDLKSVASAQAYFKIGNLPFEETLTTKIGESAPNLTFFDNSKGISLISGTHSHAHSDDGHHDHNSGNEPIDPHTWSSVKNLKIIASNMCESLSEIDPKRAAYYADNHARLQHRLDSIDKAIEYRISSSAEGASFLIWHPSLSYFARDYGLRQITLGEENKDMSAKRLRDNIMKAADSNVKAIFIQKNFDPAQAENVALQLNITPVEINPLSADWEGELNNVTNAIISR
ncbi:MAG: zinc ABC transporter substrate-binding protein [Muribaculaceae bacterium]|nr:zinc ABC transporter substrate-binding protein [Muribaculaceae bacterium]